MKFHMWNIKWNANEQAFESQLIFDNRERADSSPQAPMAIEGFMECLYWFPATVPPEVAFKTLQEWMLENLVTRPAEVETWVQRIKAINPEYDYVIDCMGCYHGPFVGATLHRINPQETP